MKRRGNTVEALAAQGLKSVKQNPGKYQKENESFYLHYKRLLSWQTSYRLHLPHTPWQINTHSGKFNWSEIQMKLQAWFIGEDAAWGREEPGCCRSHLPASELHTIRTDWASVHTLISLQTLERSSAITVLFRVCRRSKAVKKPPEYFLWSKPQRPVTPS